MLAACVALAVGASAFAADAPAKPAGPDGDPAFRRLAGLVGGKWVSDGQPAAEVRYERFLSGQAIRESGVLFAGTRRAVETEALFGWDAAAGAPYTLLFRGDENVYRGTLRMDGDRLIHDFRAIVGEAAHLRTVEEFPGSDRLTVTIERETGGTWNALQAFHFVHRSGDTLPAVPNRPGALPPALEKLQILLGDAWQGTVHGTDRDYVLESRYERAAGGRALRGRTVVGKGLEHPVEAIHRYGWDPVKKSVYFIEAQSTGQVFFGSTEPAEDGVRSRFDRIVGAPGSFRTALRFPARNTERFSFFQEQDGKETELLELDLKRRPS